MTTPIQNTGTICPICTEPLDPSERNRWDEHLQVILCQYCYHELWHWLTTHEAPEQRLIDIVEELSSKKYWEYQIHELEKFGPLDEETMKVLVDAMANKRRSAFRLL